MGTDILRQNVRRVVTVEGGIGSGTYTEGDVVKIIAVVPAGQVFTRFTTNDIPLVNEATAKTTFIMPAHDVKIKTNFIAQTAEVVSVAVLGGMGTGDYLPGAVVILSATVKPGDQFTKWTGLDDVTFLEGTDEKSRMVKFLMPEMPLHIAAVTKSIQIATYHVAVDHGIGEGFYREKDIVTLMANTAEEGMRFTNWKGLDDVIFVEGTSVSSRTVQFKMPSSSMTVVAIYESIPDKPSYRVVADTAIDGVVIEGEGSYKVGEQVKISVQVPDNYSFDGWITSEIEFEDDTSPVLVFEMPEGEVSLLAQFSEKVGMAQYELIVGNGFGDGAYIPNTVVDIVAELPENKRFIEWELVSGKGQIFDTKAESTTIITGSENTIVQAVLETVEVEPHYELTIQGGAGSGSYKEGEEIVVTATPEIGKIFVGWVEVAQMFMPSTIEEAMAFSYEEPVVESYMSHELSYTFTMPSRACTLTAVYDEEIAATHKVTVIGGQGSGYYEEGATVSVTVDEIEDGIFTLWATHGVVVEDIMCPMITFKMPADDVTIEAQYAQIPMYTVSVDTSVKGITYEGSGEYRAGDVVTVSAVVEQGYTFVGWSVSGLVLENAMQTTLTFTMPEEDVVLIGQTDLIPVIESYEVTVEGGLGTGYYAFGETVKIYADLPEGKVFDGWHIVDEISTLEIADKNSEQTHFIMGNEAVTITANYVDKPIEVNYKVIAIGATGDGDYHADEEVTVLPSPPEGYRFSKWEVNGMPDMDLESSVLTFMMPKREVCITACFELIEEEINYYPVEVIDGIGTGNYVEGETVILTADNLEDQIFTSWTLEGIEVEDLTATTITFDMPAISVKAVANFEAVVFETTQTPIITSISEVFTEQIEVVITSEKDAAIYYTTDGTEPCQTSALYTVPITLTETTTVKAMAVVGGKLTSEGAIATFTREEHTHKPLEVCEELVVIDEAIEEVIYTGISSDFAVQKLKGLVGGGYTSKQLEQMVLTPKLLKELGVIEASRLQRLTTKSVENPLLVGNYRIHKKVKK